MALVERRTRARDEPLGQVLVEARDDYREGIAHPAVACALAAVVAVLRSAVQQLLVEVQALVVQRVAHALGLRAQIRLVVLVGGMLDRDLCATDSP